MARVICIGLGPGDPDLMSVKSHRLLGQAKHVAYFRKRNSPGQARRIVADLLPAGVQEYPMEYPLTTELPFDSVEYKQTLSRFYDDWTDKLAGIAASDDVIVLCEGDPFFYGSYMHLYVRLQDRVEQEIVPGITGMSGCWTATGKPMAWGDDVMSVLVGTLPEERLVDYMRRSDAIAIMKTGKNLPKIKRALASTNRLEDAWLVENGTSQNERITKLTDVNGLECPYFATVIVHGTGRRP